MVEAKSRDRWNHTSAVLALYANCHRDAKKSRSFRPADFHPHAERKTREKKPMADITLLKQVFVDRGD